MLGKTGVSLRIEIAFGISMETSCLDAGVYDAHAQRRWHDVTVRRYPPPGSARLNRQEARTRVN